MAHNVLTVATVEKNMGSKSLRNTLTDCTVEAGIHGGSLRPDQTNFLINPDKTITVMVGDVKCFYPSLGSLARTHERNQTKYQFIADSYAQKYGSAEVVTIMIPTVGPCPEGPTTP